MVLEINVRDQNSFCEGRAYPAKALEGKNTLLMKFYPGQVEQMIQYCLMAGMVYELRQCHTPVSSWVVLPPIPKPRKKELCKRTKTSIPSSYT